MRSPSNQLYEASPLGFKVEWSREVKEIVLDSREFPECIVKEREVGWVRKRHYYIHRRRDGWMILVLPDLKSYVILDQSACGG